MMDASAIVIYIREFTDSIDSTDSMGENEE